MYSKEEHNWIIWGLDEVLRECVLHVLLHVWCANFNCLRHACRITTHAYFHKHAYFIELNNKESGKHKSSHHLATFPSIFYPNISRSQLVFSATTVPFKRRSAFFFTEKSSTYILNLELKIIVFLFVFSECTVSNILISHWEQCHLFRSVLFFWTIWINAPLTFSEFSSD